MPRNCWTRCNKTFPCSFPAREKTREIESRETSKRLEKQAILALLRKMIYKIELIWEDNNMSRLGMLYALNEEDVKKLRSVPEEERYEYMLEEIEEALIGSPRSCELDKAWEGIQYCLGGGQWNEDNCIPTNIVFGGEVLVETDDEIITLKNHQDVRDIVEYLHQNKLQEIIQKNFWNIDDENFMYKNDDGLEHTLGWSEEILAFYENALKENCQVIFTVDF